MNAMSAEGWTPNLSLWEEPGTLMDKISSVTVWDSVTKETLLNYYSETLYGAVADQRPATATDVSSEVPLTIPLPIYGK